MILFSQSGFVYIYLKKVYKTKNLSKYFVLKKFLLKFTVSFLFKFFLIKPCMSFTPTYA
jgi:hypothetical protein